MISTREDLEVLVEALPQADYWLTDVHHKSGILELMERLYATFTNKMCTNCVYFEADDSIDPNEHFGYCCNMEACAAGNIVVLDFGCNKFEWRNNDNDL